MSEEEKILRKQAWDHLVLSSQQRISVLNFYFLIATALSGSLFILIQKETSWKVIGIPGLLLSVLTLIFWQWDKRSAFFVKNSEKTLLHFEKKYKILNEDDATLFIRIQDESEKNKPKSFTSFPYLSFKHVLRYLFSTFATIGIIGCPATTIITADDN